LETRGFIFPNLLPAQKFIKKKLGGKSNCSEGASEISPAHRAGCFVQTKIRPEGTAESFNHFPSSRQDESFMVLFTGDVIPG
jgi:hypothetical protein